MSSEIVIIKEEKVISYAYNTVNTVASIVGTKEAYYCLKLDQ